MKRLLVLLAALALNTAYADSAKQQHALFFGKDDRVKIRPHAQPWRAIGQIETASGQICTASLIAADLVLTAGHCFLNEAGKLDAATLFSLALDGEQAAIRVRPARVYVAQRLFDGIKIRADGMIIAPEVAALDYAFVRLAQPLAPHFKPLPVFQGSSQALRAALQGKHWRVSQAGYPIDDDSHLSAHLNCRVSAQLSDGRLSHQCDTLPGDSGSPLLLMHGEQASIIAIQSSAPDAAHRAQADNMALSTPAWQAVLKKLQRRRH
ncbi:trypsin-like serine protease [Craterilacuibacter sp. RT1T]|uniref:trypsin-like serine peptidase n=1 Tax=Craterilacuibacter sp. RT1T TaxID=2942211 RepID=UPI0020C182CF|nr:trypsin-like serine protease [Craterilacuibacter sp. RT1T]MCL6262409.1 trypsin-like serine protease [Craterilacuibacter sp. RT1T]